MGYSRREAGICRDVVRGYLIPCNFQFVPRKEVISMFPMKTFDERFQAILDGLDALAAESGDDTLEELNAEFEDALLLISEIDMKSGDWREEYRDALEELDALRRDYARLPGAEHLARQLDGLIRMAEGEL